MVQQMIGWSWSLFPHPQPANQHRIKREILPHTEQHCTALQRIVPHCTALSWSGCIAWSPLTSAGGHSHPLATNYTMHSAATCIDRPSCKCCNTCKHLNLIVRLSDSYYYCSVSLAKDEVKTPQGPSTRSWVAPRLLVPDICHEKYLSCKKNQIESCTWT